MAEEEENFVKFIAENKGKRKFKQSVELAINFKGIDFSKQDNRLNLDVLLPNGKGKVRKVAIFATEKNFIEDAKKRGVEVIDGNSLNTMAEDSAKMNSLLNYELLSQPNLMPNIAKYLGKFLGPRNRMPKPIMGSNNLEKMTQDLDRMITIRNKGKFLPTVHCVVGSEDMEPARIYANVDEVLKNVKKKVGQGHIKSVYVKLTMSKPMKMM